MNFEEFLIQNAPWTVAYFVCRLKWNRIFRIRRVNNERRCGGINFCIMKRRR